MATATITAPAYTVFIAGVTRHTFSGMTSFVSAATDGSRRIMAWDWDFGDGTTGSGGVVQHQWATSGVKTVRLTITADDGTTATTTTAITVAATPDFTYFDKRLRSNGTGDYTTADAAINAWRSDVFGLPALKWGRVKIPAGDTVTLTTANGWDFGRMLVVKEGTGADPIILVGNDQEFSQADDTHNNSFDNPVVFDGVEVRYATKQNPNVGGGFLKCFHVACSQSGSGTYFGVRDIRGSGFVLYSANVLNAGDSGIAVSGGVNFCVIDSCTAKGNGLDDVLDVQMYLSGVDQVGVLSTTCDQTGATASYGGFKTSGVTKSYFGAPYSKACFTAFDVGSNSNDAELLDIVYQNPILESDTGSVGFFANYCNRISIRNARCYGGCSSTFLNESSYTGLGKVVRGIDLFGASCNGLSGQVAQFTTSSFSDVNIKNSAFVKSGAGVFYTLQLSADVSRVAIDYNVYWRVGGTPDADANFASVQGVTKTWAQWQALGLDTHSKFRDPLFTGAGDLRLQAGSPCLAVGTTLGVIGKDCAGTTRTAPYDIGAFQSSSAPPPQNPPAGPSCGDRLQSYQAAMKEVYAYGGQVRRGLFG